MAARGKGESHRTAKRLYECTREPEDAIVSAKGANGLRSRSQPRGAAGARSPGGLETCNTNKGASIEKFNKFLSKFKFARMATYGETP